MHDFRGLGLESRALPQTYGYFGYLRLITPTVVKGNLRAALRGIHGFSVYGLEAQALRVYLEVHGWVRV